MITEPQSKPQPKDNENEKRTFWNLENYKDQLAFKIPKIKCPWNHNENIHLWPTLEAHNKWVIESKMLNRKEKAEKFISLEGYIMTANLHPRNNESDWIFINKINDWLFIVDDVLLESRKMDMEYLDNLFNENGKHDVYGEILWTLFKEKLQTNPKSGVEYYLNCLYDWSKSVITLNNTDEEAVKNMSIEEYCRYRYKDVGGLIILTGMMIDYPAFPDEILKSNEFLKISYWYTTANLLINDIYSFKKETKCPRLGNYIKIKTLECGNIQDAMDYTRDYLHKCFEKIIKWTDRAVKKFPEDEVLPIYVSRLKESTAGNIRGSSICKRYNGNYFDGDIRTSV